MHPEILKVIKKLFFFIKKIIKKAGRISHLEPIELPEDDRAAKLEELNTNDPVSDRLKAITEDKR